MKRALFIVSLALIAFGCRKDPDYDKLSTNYVVATNADLQANFGQYKTYHVSDTIRLLSDTNDDTILTDNNAKMLVDEVKAQMAARGYTFVPRGGSIDIGINMALVKNLNVNTVVYPGWWYGWWYGWYWGGYYPPYYGWSYTYAYTTGSLYISAADLKNAASTGKITMLWDALLGGVLADQTAENYNKALDGIDQAFKQSPYFKTN